MCHLIKSLSCVKTTISEGNMKIGDIPNVSLSPIVTCPACPCRKKCYAMKADRNYPSARQAWQHNTHMARHRRNRFFADIHAYLNKHNPRFFRWHVAGDILDQDYANRMMVLACQFPETRFLVFTKRHDLDYSRRPKNLSIIASMWPGWGNPDSQPGLVKAWCQDGTETRIPANALHCPGSCETCNACWFLDGIGRDVVFDIH